MSLQLLVCLRSLLLGSWLASFCTMCLCNAQERLDQELRLVGEYGLKNKREVWRVQYALAKIRSAARELLTLEEKDPRRIFQGTLRLRFSLFFAGI